MNANTQFLIKRDDMIDWQYTDELLRQERKQQLRRYGLQALRLVGRGIKGAGKATINGLDEWIKSV